MGIATHELKCWPEFFVPIIEGRKRFEVRLDDREDGYRVGDILRLREWDPMSEMYTGMATRVRVTYMIRGGDCPALEDADARLVVMSIETAL